MTYQPMIGVEDFADIFGPPAGHYDPADDQVLRRHATATDRGRPGAVPGAMTESWSAPKVGRRGVRAWIGFPS